LVNLIKPELESDTICVLERFERGREAPVRFKALLQEETLHLDTLLDRLAAIS